MTRVKKIKKKMNAGGCSSIMGGAENKKKRKTGGARGPGLQSGLGRFNP